MRGLTAYVKAMKIKKRAVSKANSKIDVRGKGVEQYDLQGNFIKKWVSASQASRKLKINQKNISLCCNNKRKTAGGYIWRFSNDR